MRSSGRWWFIGSGARVCLSSTGCQLSDLLVECFGWIGDHMENMGPELVHANPDLRWFGGRYVCCLQRFM